MNARRFDSQILADMAAVEARQARPTRELMLDPGNAGALARLQALEQQLAVLRAELASPPDAPPDAAEPEPTDPTDPPPGGFLTPGGPTP